MIRVLLVPSSDYVGHPFLQRHNQIFERLHDGKNFEVHVVRFVFFEKPNTDTKLVLHELGSKKAGHIASYYLRNAVDHAVQIRKIVKQEGIDVVVLSNLAAPCVYTLIDMLSSNRVPTIFDLPDYYPTSAAGYLSDVRSLSGRLFAGLLDYAMRPVLRHAKTVTVASAALGVYARRSGARNVVHVPNGVGECFLKLHDGSVIREKLGFRRNDIVVGYIGSVEFWLDMSSLIEGVALAREQGLPVVLLIVGRKLHTNFSESVERKLKEESLAEYTTWLDFVPYEQVPVYMAGLDVGVVPFDVSNPTAYYAGPNKIWEYLSQSKPVIASPIPEVIDNSDCVFIASTPENYARSLLLIGKGGAEVTKKVSIGYGRAVKRTWENSSKLLACTIYSVLNKEPDNRIDRAWPPTIEGVNLER